MGFCTTSLHVSLQIDNAFRVPKLMLLCKRVTISPILGVQRMSSDGISATSPLAL